MMVRKRPSHTSGQLADILTYQGQRTAELVSEKERLSESLTKYELRLSFRGIQTDISRSTSSLDEYCT